MLKFGFLLAVILGFYYLNSKLEIFLACLIYVVLYPQVKSKVALYYKPSDFTAKVLSKCPSLTSRFYPTIWLCNGVLQAFFEGIIDELQRYSIFCDSVDFTTEHLELPDNGLMSIDWAFPKELLKKILIIGPGLTGDSNSQYVRSMTIAALNKGYTVAVLHGRGIGGNKLTVRNM